MTEARNKDSISLNGSRKRQAVAVGVLLVMAGCASRGRNQAFDVSPYPVTSDTSRITDANRTILTTGTLGLAGAAGAGGVSDEYRIGPQDQVRIDVFGVETFNGTFQVDQGGDIALPLLGSVAVAGSTPRDLETNIEARLRDTYMKDPHVTVQVVEVLSHGVSVIGAVRQPGVYQIRGRTTLLEVLALAEGLAENAGSSVFVVRQAPAGTTRPDSLLTQDLASLPGGPSGDVIEVNLGQLLGAGRTEANIEVRAGDIVQVRPAGLVYVVGDVMRPGGFTIPPGAPMTVLHALAMAEGLARNAAADESMIVRQAEDGSRQEVPIDLEEVLNGSVPPPTLRESDVLYVPHNGSKAFGMGVVNALVGMVTFRGLFY